MPGVSVSGMVTAADSDPESAASTVSEEPSFTSPNADRETLGTLPEPARNTVTV